MSSGHPTGSSPAALAPACEAHAALFELLQEVLDRDEAPAPWPGELVSFDEPGSPTATQAGQGPRCTAPLRLPGEPAQGEPVPSLIEFADDPGVPFPFRGRRLRSAVWPGRPLSLREGERPLATVDGQLAWAVSASSGLQRSALPLPSVSRDAHFADLFCGARFLNLLPLLHVLRQRAVPEERPPARAAFVIDDPNLHWPRYGHVDYRAVAQRAARERYHVAFATIPLDAWFTHPGAAQLFRSQPDTLSLLVHGNNHARNELARRDQAPALQQALRRIARLERVAGVPVARVMVPPHGACTGDTLAELPACGFEAACVSTGSLRHHNPAKAWTRRLGFHPVETIEGCPVLARWGVEGDPRNDVLVAACLGRPMVLRGHHADLADALERLDQLARFVNSLGPVTWSGLQEIARSRWTLRLDGRSARLRLGGLVSEVDLPEGVERLVLEPACGPHDAALWNVAGAGWSALVTGSGGFERPETAGRRLRITRLAPTRPMLPDAPLQPALVLRRVLAEARDRAFAAAHWIPPRIRSATPWWTTQRL